MAHLEGLPGRSLFERKEIRARSGRPSPVVVNRSRPKCLRCCSARRAQISAYQKCVAETVQRFGGFVAKYLGDGVLVYFGWPQAHEDDAERAVRGGTSIG